METTVRSGWRRTLEAGSVALAALALTVGAAGAGRADSSSAVTYARAANGQLVAVGAVPADTPVHPEAITHPQLDFMGSSIARGPRANAGAAGSGGSGGVEAPAAVGGSAATGASGASGAGVAARAATRAAAVPQLPGIDVSSYQGDIDWTAVAPYIDFAYAKATEGTYYTNPDFTNQYDGPYNAGVIRGAYHFAIPDNSSGAAQADYFIAHGGGWSGDGKTLPGALDIEYNPYGAECYGLSQSSMVSWLWSFVDEYAAKEGAYPVIYSTTDWWSACTGSYAGFAAYDPLWIANYTVSGGGTLPAGWGFYTFWQYADSGSEPGDQDVFNGAYSQLQVLAQKG